MYKKSVRTIEVDPNINAYVDYETLNIFLML